MKRILISGLVYMSSAAVTVASDKLKVPILPLFGLVPQSVSVDTETTVLSERNISDKKNLSEQKKPSMINLFNLNLNNIKEKSKSGYIQSPRISNLIPSDQGACSPGRSNSKLKREKRQSVIITSIPFNSDDDDQINSYRSPRSQQSPRIQGTPRLSKTQGTPRILPKAASELGYKGNDMPILDEVMLGGSLSTGSSDLLSPSSTAKSRSPLGMMAENKSATFTKSTSTKSMMGSSSLSIETGLQTARSFFPFPSSPLSPPSTPNNQAKISEKSDRQHDNRDIHAEAMAYYGPQGVYGRAVVKELKHEPAFYNAAHNKITLSLDGGGGKGYIQALILLWMEQRIEQIIGQHLKIGQLFYVIGGTSTGAISTTSLTTPSDDDCSIPKYSARDLVDLYESDCYRIFERSLMQRLTTGDGYKSVKYSDANLDKILLEKLGHRTLDQSVTNMFATTYELRSEGQGSGPALLRSYDLGGERACTMEARCVAQASGAAPTYFPPEVIAYGNLLRAFIDGGLIGANNPSTLAFLESYCLCREQEIEAKMEDYEWTKPADFLHVSLGVGEFKQFFKPDDFTGSPVGMVSKIITVALDAPKQINAMMLELYGKMTGSYNCFRFSPEVDKAIGLDDMSDATLTYMRRAALKYIVENQPALNIIIERLVFNALFRDPTLNPKLYEEKMSLYNSRQQIWAKAKIEEAKKEQQLYAKILGNNVLASVGEGELPIDQLSENMAEGIRQSQNSQTARYLMALNNGLSPRVSPSSSLASTSYTHDNNAEKIKNIMEIQRNLMRYMVQVNDELAKAISVSQNSQNARHPLKLNNGPITKVYPSVSPSPSLASTSYENDAVKINNLNEIKEKFIRHKNAEKAAKREAENPNSEPLIYGVASAVELPHPSANVSTPRSQTPRKQRTTLTELPTWLSTLSTKRPRDENKRINLHQSDDKFIDSEQMSQFEENFRHQFTPDCPSVNDDQSEDQSDDLSSSSNSPQSRMNLLQPLRTASRSHIVAPGLNQTGNNSISSPCSMPLTRQLASLPNTDDDNKATPRSTNRSRLASDSVEKNSLYKSF